MKNNNLIYFGVMCLYVYHIRALHPRNKHRKHNAHLNIYIYIGEVYVRVLRSASFEIRLRFRFLFSYYYYYFYYSLPARQWNRPSFGVALSVVVYCFCPSQKMQLLYTHIYFFFTYSPSSSSAAAAAAAIILINEIFRLGRCASRPVRASRARMTHVISVAIVFIIIVITYYYERPSRSNGPPTYAISTRFSGDVL